MWEFWRRHKRKVYVALGAFGGGYVLYRLYDSRRRSLSALHRQLADERESEEIIKAQIQAHFQSVQRIADSATMPHVMHFLDIHLAESLDLTPLTERLIQGKDQANALTKTEKLELWDRLKILSFTKMVSSIWALTMLCLYIRVQVNILGRHLYIDTARGLGSSHLLDEAEMIDKNDEQQFLACADYLSNRGVLSLISDTEAVTSEVLKGQWLPLDYYVDTLKLRKSCSGTTNRKHLKDIFSTMLVHDAIIHILDTLMIRHSPSQWVGYLMPEDGSVHKYAAPSNTDGSDLSHVTKFELLIGETRAVLSSTEFADIVDISLRAVVNAVLEDLNSHCGKNNLMSGMPLARLLPRIALMAQQLLTESNRGRYILMIRNIPEVEQFFTLLYSSTPA